MAEKPKGRAALRLALLNQRPGDVEAAAPATDAPPGPPPVTEAPKPRGRAALLMKFKSLQAPGVIPSTPAPQSSVVAPVTVPTPVATITEKVERLEVAETFKKAEKGTSGKPIGLKANYIRMAIQAGKGLHKYEVKYNPGVDSKAARRKLIKEILPELGGIHIFNGVNDLYLPMKLGKDVMTFQRVHPFDAETLIEMTIIFKKLESYGSPDGIHFLNVLFKRIMYHLKLVQIKRSYFDFQMKTLIQQHALEVIPGYAVAVDEMEGGLMICLDTCHKYLSTKTVLQLLMELFRTPNPKERACTELLGQSVITTYSNINYVVDDILWDSRPTDTFESALGSVTYIDYYKKHYGIEIKNHTQPLLLNMRRKKTSVPGEEEIFKICLVPELCKLTGVSQDMMTRQFKAEMAQHTRLPPAKRFEVLEKYIRAVRTNEDAKKVLTDWGLSLDGGAIDLNARVIEDTRVCFKSKSVSVGGPKIDWGRDAGSDNLINPIDMTAWLVLYPDRDCGVTQKFVARLRDLGKNMGCTITPPKMIGVGKGMDLDYRNALEMYANSDHVQIVFIVVPAARETLYSLVKNITLSKKGVLGQVARVQTLQNERLIGSIVQKIAHQMQAKLGGSLWAVSFPSVCNNFMFAGIDTYHSKALKKSVGAIVCSIDERHTRYYTGIAFQAHEVADALKLHFKAALEERRAMTGRFPSEVFMVRDGVGDGDLQHVKQYEMQQYLSVCEELGTNSKLCFIIIQKRTNARIMTTRGSLNPPPGTVIDHTITRRTYDDFFMVPQGARIGTVSPAHYIILHNDSTMLTLDRIQKLCFKLCHLYYNWSGAVSVPAPCQYAHKAAYLIGEHMERKPLDSLNTKLYYL